MAQHAFLDKIGGSPLQDYIVGVKGYANELTIEVKPEHIYVVLKMMKEKYAFNYLSDITASDYYTDEKRFEVAYNIVSMEAQQRLRITCRVEEDAPTLDSVVKIWGSADWFEREAYDMMGIVFRNHPDLRRMYMPEDFAFFPLRKEFPLLGIPGSIELPEKVERTF
jgi:NADH-quinone oxidoreductase subunit C